MQSRSGSAIYAASVPRKFAEFDFRTFRTCACAIHPLKFTNPGDLPFRISVFSDISFNRLTIRAGASTNSTTEMGKSENSRRKDSRRCSWNVPVDAYPHGAIPNCSLFLSLSRARATIVLAVYPRHYNGFELRAGIEISVRARVPVMASRSENPPPCALAR